MSTITLKYRLSEQAQRNELAAGRDASRSRSLQLEPNEWLASITKLSYDGKAEINLCWTGYNEQGQRSDHGYGRLEHEADHVLTQDDAEQWIRKQMAAFELKSMQLRKQYEEHQKERAEVQAEAEKKRIENEARKAKEQAEREAKLVPFREACRQYVIKHVPEYRRAAEDGHDMTEITKRAVLESLERQITERGYQEIDIYGTEERECPKAHAYSVYDALADIEQGVPTELINSIDREIVRADVKPQGDALYRTAVELVIHWANDTKDERHVLADEDEVPDFNDDEDEDDY